MARRQLGLPAVGPTGNPYIDRAIDALLLTVEAKRAGAALPSTHGIHQFHEFAAEGARKTLTEMEHRGFSDELKTLVNRLVADNYEVSGHLLQIQLAMSAEILDRLCQVTGMSPLEALNSL